jgi:hypothetical protein
MSKVKEALAVHHTYFYTVMAFLYSNLHTVHTDMNSAPMKVSGELSCPFCLQSLSGYNNGSIVKLTNAV